VALLAARLTRSGVGQVSYNGVAAVLRGCSSMAEPQPSKLVMGVRFPSPAPLFASARSGQQPCRPTASVRSMGSFEPLTKTCTGTHFGPSKTKPVEYSGSGHPVLPVSTLGGRQAQRWIVSVLRSAGLHLATVPPTVASVAFKGGISPAFVTRRPWGIHLVAIEPSDAT
jgi:hypothetical protein